jgi:hypothetical protein
MEAWSLEGTQGGWFAGIVSAGYMLGVVPLVAATDRILARRVYLASAALSVASSSISRSAIRSFLRFAFGLSPASALPGCTCRDCAR